MKKLHPRNAWTMSWFLLTTISLILFMQCGDDDDKKKDPIASFELINEDPMYMEDIIDFQNLSEDADEYLWYFGDGGTSSEVHPGHVYAISGDYSVYLFASNDNGSDEATMVITILPLEAEKDNEIVNIPDQSFLHALIEEGVDTNGDGLISFGEAEEMTTLDFGENTSLSDLTGLEAFVNLESLTVISINMETIDITKLKELRYLRTGVNSIRPYTSGLTSLDASNNTKLEEIHCHFNKISLIDISNCINLRILDLGCNHPLTHLDVSKNINLEELGIHFNENLSEVCVGTEDFPDLVAVDDSHCPNVYFTTDCQ